MRSATVRQTDAARIAETRRPRRAFTLIEVMIVIGIIVVMTAMAIPLFNFIMGNRSQDAAENLISAMLGRARNYAIANQRYAGVAFFLDPTSQRSTMALVIQRAPGSASSEDPYDNYKGWSPTTLDPANNENPTPHVYAEGQQAIWTDMVGDPDGVNPNQRRLVIRKFSVEPGRQATPGDVPPSSPWIVAGLGLYYDFIIDGDLQTLPIGVGCQLINDARPQRNLDRYVRTGVIFFDPEGRLASIPCSIGGASELGQLLRLAGDFPQAASSGPNPIDFRSQMGLILYDQEEFSGQGFTEDDSVMAVYAPPPPPAYSGQEQQEEEWLDTNGLQLLVSRYTGTLLRGE